MKTVSLSDWNEFVRETYGRPYSLRQQEESIDGQTLTLTVPDKWADEDEMHEEVPETLYTNKKGVTMEKWLERDPSKSIKNGDLELWWMRNFFPDVNILANDLLAKGLIEEGTYLIVVD